jgi:hypothetical protein
MKITIPGTYYNLRQIRQPRKLDFGIKPYQNTNSRNNEAPPLKKRDGYGIALDNLVRSFKLAMQAQLSLSLALSPSLYFTFLLEYMKT